MLRQISDFNPERYIYTTNSGDYDSCSYDFKVNISRNGCLLFYYIGDVSSPSKDGGYFYLNGYRSGTASSIYSNTEFPEELTPVYSGDRIYCSVSFNHSWCDYGITKRRIKVTLFQGNTDTISELLKENGKFNIKEDSSRFSSKYMLCDNLLCTARVIKIDNGKVYISAGISGLEKVNEIRTLLNESGINTDETPYFCGNVVEVDGKRLYHDTDYDNFSIASYNSDTGEITGKYLTDDVNNGKIKVGSKLKIYTCYLINPDTELEYVQTPEIPLVSRDFGKNEISATGKINLPVKWYRWTFEDNFISPKKYDYTEKFKYKFYYPPESATLEICDEYGTIHTRTASEFTVKPEDKGQLDYTKISLSNGTAYKYIVKLPKLNSESFNHIAVLAIDESGNSRIVCANLSQYSAVDGYIDLRFYDYGMKYGQYTSYIIYVWDKNENFVKYTLAKNYINKIGLSLQELKKTGYHKYGIGDKSILFVSADSSTDVKTNVGINVFDISEQPTIIKSDKDYEEGTVTADLLEFNSVSIIDNTERIKLWQSILKSDNPYLLKTPKGECFIVAISDAGGRTYNSDTELTTINFSWKEIDKFDNCHIFNEE